MKFITLNLEEERVENTYTIDKCIRKDKLNGLATVEFSTLNNHLEKYYRLLYKNHKGKWKEFIIVSIDMIHTNEGIEYLVYAEDSIVEIKGDFIEDKRNRMATYSSCAKKVFEDTRWRLIAESSLEKHNLSFYRQSAFKSFNDILQKFSCEYETLITVVDSKVTDRVVHLTNRLGNDLGKRFSWSKDMEKISKKANEYEIITALYPYGNGEEIGEGYGRRIDISEVNNGVPYLENLEAKEKYGFINSDGSRRHRFGKREYDTDDKAELKKVRSKRFRYFSNPSITYTATVIDLKNYGIDLDGVDIGDIVSIRDKEANITLRARVLELEEDLDNIEETTIVLGNYRPIFGSSLNNMKDSLSRLESKEGVYDSFKPVDPGDQSFIDIAIENLNKSFNSGTSNIFFDKNRGLVVTDKPNEKDSNWIMELSSQGFRIANSKKSNGEWNFRTFGTGDGFTADQLITGIIRGGKSFWNLETGELDIGGIFKVDGSGSGSLDPVLKEELRGDKGDAGEDAIIVSTSEPVDKSKIWRKSITDPNLYIYIDGEWVEIDSQLQDIVLQVQEEISGQEDKWQGDINTNIKNVVEELTKFQSDLSKLNDELTGKANVEQVLNEEEVKKTVEDIISKYPEIVNLNQHFNFGTDGLRITATDASNKEVDTSVLIKNDGLAIEVEGQTAAYFKQNETLTPNLNVEWTAWVGNHAMLGFNGYDADGSYNENKNITAFAWSPRKKEDS